MSDSIPVVATDLTTLQSAAAETGDGTALNVLGHGVVIAQVTGTFVGTVTFEGTADGTNYVSLQGINVATGAEATTATAVGILQFPIAGLTAFRARVSAYTSGTITVKARALPMTGPSIVSAVA